jgi:hypothetical protein
MATATSVTVAMATGVIATTEIGIRAATVATEAIGALTEAGRSRTRTVRDLMAVTVRVAAAATATLPLQVPLLPLLQRPQWQQEHQAWPPITQLSTLNTMVLLAPVPLPGVPTRMPLMEVMLLTCRCTSSGMPHSKPLEHPLLPRLRPDLPRPHLPATRLLLRLRHRVLRLLLLQVPQELAVIVQYVHLEPFYVYELANHVPF